MKSILTKLSIAVLAKVNLSSATETEGDKCYGLALASG